MFILGLTGSIGTGKSTTANLFRGFGIPVYDADKTVHSLYAGDAVEPVAAAFPEAIVDGKVDRKALKEVLARDARHFAQLERIIHPLVHAKEAEARKKARAEGHRLFVLDIPLLFETGGDARCDAVLVTMVEKAEQMRRVLARGGISEADVHMLLARQMPQEEKIRRAHAIINTGFGIEAARREVIALLRALAPVMA
jgi:dephospho-CoA kinase